MARKNIGKILSGGVILFCIALFYAPGIGVLAAFEPQYVTFTISGSAGAGGVTMSGFPNGPVISDENGFYQAIVPYGWNGTVTPILRGYNFNPPSKNYSKVSSNLDNEDYIASLMTFTISGTAGLSGVEMNGLPGNPITKDGGLYSVQVDYGWSGTVIPTKEGYTFSPEQKQYNLVTKDQANENYNATEITLLISGSVGEPGVIMKGLPGDPTTMGKEGTYSVSVKYGFSGTVTPVKEGYEFNPPNIQYSDLITSQTNQDYYATQITYMISGTTGMQGVLMKNLPGDPATDENGYYSTTIPHGWSGTVVPEKAGFTFKPASKTYSNVTSEKTNENYEYTLVQLKISGSAGLEGVEMNGLPGNPISGSGGLYSANVDYGWNGMITPIKEGYTFNPENKSYNLITRDQTNQIFTPERMKFQISGSVGVDGVEISGLPVKTVSDRNGFYTAEVDYGFTGELTPRRPGYEFDPSSRSYTNLIGPEINQNYEATVLKRILSGIIQSDKGQPVENVTLTATGGGTVITTSDGTYELEVDYGWRGTVTPTKEGYTFTPSNKPYGAVTRDQTQQRYTAILKMFTVSGKIDYNGTPIQGVTITANNGGGSDITDAKGNYSVKVPYDWTGEITPTKAGMVFNPASEPYYNVTSDYKDGQPVISQIPEPKLPSPTPGPLVPTPQTTTTTSTLPRPEEQQIPTPKQTLPTPDETASAETLPTEERTPMQDDLESIKEKLERLMAQQTQGEEVEQPPISTALPIEPGVPRITNNIVDEELPSVLQVLASIAGIPIIPDEDVQLDQSLVSCSLKDVPLDRALEIVLAGTPYVVKKTPYYYLVCSGDIESPMFSAVSSTRRLKLSYVKADMAASLLSTHFQKYVQAEPEGNTILVTAPSPLLDRIVDDLKQIDQVPTHVLLDARIVIIERGDLLNLGVEWGWPRLQAGFFGNNAKGGGGGVLPDFGGKWPWGVQIGYAPDATFTNALELTLNLMAQNGELRTLAKPQVFAQDGKEAQMNVMTEEYYMLTAQAQTTYYQYSEMQEISSGTKLQITPHIGDNNDITLELAVEVSDSIARGSETDLPVVTRRTAQNTVRIKDGGTVALAGLTENKTRTDLRRVPGLSKLPLIGKLFSSTSRENSTREIAVFVTARIVPDTVENVSFEEPTAPAAPGATAPGQPVEETDEDFKASLRESLMRSSSLR